MKNTLHLVSILGVTAISTLHSEEVAAPAIPPVDPCLGIHQQVTALVAGDPVGILEIVSKEVAANQSCSCDVVKAAIQQSKLEPKTVAAIVEAAILAAPEHMRMIAQCAIAAAPEATAEVQAVVARLDPASGDGSVESAKSAKSAKAATGPEDVAYVTNPLDFPAQGPDGLAPGAPLNGGPTLGGLTPSGSTPAGFGGVTLLPPFTPGVINIPVTNPPVVTTVNP